MGTSSSKASDSNLSRTSSLKRSFKNRKSTQSKAEQIEAKFRITSNLKSEIDIFAGDRTSDRYKEFQKILTTTATELQKLKSSTKKQEHHDRCDEVLGEVQNCLQRLENKVNLNEQGDNSLDLAAVESHSFINQSFKRQEPAPPAPVEEKRPNQLPGPKKRQHKFDSIKTLDRIEQETQNLEREIKRSIELEDTKQFVFYENKIKILYADLEMIRVDDHTPLSEKKATLGKRLIKINNHLKRFKKAHEKKIQSSPSTQDGSALSKPRDKEVQLDALSKTGHLLEDLEIQALTFEGVKTDKKYKELEQIVESHWTMVYSIDAFGDEHKRRKALAIERIKNILQELGKRADENEKQAKALKTIHTIEQELQLLKKEAETFQGTPSDPFYHNLDQELRSAWSKLSEVEEPNEHVRRRKATVISDIQYVLKNLSRDTKNRESKIYENTLLLKKSSQSMTEEEILQNQLLKQAQEFENHWHQLNHNLQVKTVTTNSDISKNILEIFEKIVEGMTKKSNQLSVAENRKSNTHLIIAKVIDSTDVSPKMLPTPNQATGGPSSTTYNILPTTYQIQYQPPDLLQQQVAYPPLAQPMPTEIKVQPTVKTIGEIQRIGGEAKVLLQQIRQSNCTKHDIEYKNFRARLQQCQSTLEAIEFNKKSDTIESNRRRATKTINEGFRLLDEKPSSKPTNDQPATRGSKTQEILDIDAGIQYFRQQIKNFTGVTKDKQYERIKQGLSDSLSKLQLIDDLGMPKQESIRQIQQYHQELETKLAENQAKVKVSEQHAEVRRQTSQDIKTVVEQVQKLRSQVDRFSGVCDGLQYKQIEGNLNKCSDKIETIDSNGDDKLESAKQQTKQKIQKYLRILQDKSTKTIATQPQSDPYEEHVIKDSTQHQQVYSIVLQEQPPLQPTLIKENLQTTKAAAPEQLQRQKLQRQSQALDPDSPHYKINYLRDKLVDIKNKTETFTGKHKDQQYSDIEAQLLNCLDELKNINDGGHQSVIITKEQYADYIQKLMEYFEDKTKTHEVQTTLREDQLVSSNPVQLKQSTFKIVDPSEELAVIEAQTSQLVAEINSFEGTSQDPSYVNLEQALGDCITKLDGVQAGNVAHVRERKRKLSQELQSCAKQLEDRAAKSQEQLKKINDILDELEEIAKEVVTFEGVKNDKNYCYLDEVMIKLTIQLDNTETYGNGELRNTRKKAIQEIQKNMKILSKRAAPKEDFGSDFTASRV